MKDIPAAIEVVHAAVPGRVRLRVAGLYRDAAAARRLEAVLAAEEGMRLASLNVLTATVVVVYDRGRDPAEVLMLVAQCIAKAGLAGSDRMPDSLRRLANPRLKHRTKGPARPGQVSPAASGQAEAAWHRQPVAEVLAHFGVDYRQGLSQAVAAERLARYGPNALPEPERRSGLAIFLGQFQNLPTLLLGASAVLSVATGSLADAAVILAVVLINAGIGYVTESQAERLISSLTSMPRPPVPVVREGKLMPLAVVEVVPGDILLLTPGCLVAADARLVQVKELSVDESALTGESLPVAKSAQVLCEASTPLADRLNMVYMGTSVTGGSALAVVTTTGQHTELGRIQRLVDTTRPPATPMQRQLDRLGNQLVWASLAVCGGVFAVGLMRGYGFLPMLRAAVSLAVAAVPEGLPTVATSTLALGIRDMRRHKVLIRHLDAVETLGSVQVICLDKTGTLTLNRMSVLAVYVDGQRLTVAEGRFYDEAGRTAPRQHPALAALLQVASLCNESRINGTHPHPSLEGTATENALLAMAIGAGVDVAALRRRFPLLRTQYRTEGRSYMTTWHATPEGGEFMAVKGSPEQVLALCRWQLSEAGMLAIDDDLRERIRMENERMAGEALRVLAFACRQGGGDQDGLVWLGLAGLADPIREGTRGLIRQFHAAGIKTVMITGDQSATAYAIGKHLGLSGDRKLEILDSTRLDRIEPELMSALADKVDIFSRVSPANKLQIVQGLQRAGKVVAMTGDGINDGPALKAADIGVAMGSGGTEVARSVADVVLEDDDLQTMIVAVRQGRTIYGNIRKAIHYLVSSNLSEIGVTFAAVAAGLGQPLNTMQLLWINLLTDVLPALALSLEPPEPDVLRRPPRDPQEPIIRTRDFRRYGFEALALTAGTLAAYGYGLLRYGPGPRAGTLAFMSLTLSQLLHALSCRSESHGLFEREGLPPNRWLSLALGGSAVLQLATVAVPGLRGLLGTTPIPPADLPVLAGTVSLPYLAIEATKPGPGTSSWRAS